MRIPEIADRLRELAVELGCPELRDLADATVRRSPVMRAKPTSRKVTPAVEAEIRQLRRDNPTWSQLRIARKVGVNPGRVSETLAGFRT